MRRVIPQPVRTPETADRSTRIPLSGGAAVHQRMRFVLLLCLAFLTCPNSARSTDPIHRGTISARSSGAADGWDYLRQGKYRYAQIAFRNRLRRNPKDEESRLGLGLACLELGQPNEAAQHLLPALRSRPEDPRVREGVSRALFLRARDRIAVAGFDDEARLLLLDAVEQSHAWAKLCPEAIEPWIQTTRAHFELGELSRAHEALQEARQRDASHSALDALEAELESLRILANAEERGEEVRASSLQALQELCERHAAHPAPWLRLGDFHVLFADHASALEAYTEALARQPFQNDLIEYLLVFLEVENADAHLLAGLERALDAAKQRTDDDEDPRLAALHQARGEVQLFRRNFAAARVDFRAAEKLDETRGTICSLGEALCALRLGDPIAASAGYLRAFRADASACVERLLRRGQANTVGPTLAFLADRALQEDHMEDARDLLAVAVELLPEDAACRNDHAFLCRETGAYEESIRSYRRLLELTPDDPRAWNDAALILHYHLRRDLDEAEQMYRRAVDTADALLADPETPSSRQESARGAKQDAVANLDRLRRGITERGRPGKGRRRPGSDDRDRSAQ